MPARSRAQFRYLQALAHGNIKGKSGMSPEQAREYTSHNVGPKAYKNLPEKLPKLRKMMRGGKV